MSDPAPARRQTLDFDSDAGASRARWVAGAVVVLMVLWMGSGYVLPSDTAAEDTLPTAAARVVTVAVTRSVATDVEQVFIAEGQALPDRDTAIRAETSGAIGEIVIRKGTDVAAGDVIARFDTASRASELNRAEAELTRSQRDLDNAQALLDRGVATQDRVSEARATLAGAEADAIAARQDIADTEIRAPFAGRLEALDIAIGEFVATGTEVGRIVDNTPLTIRIQIPQQALRGIEVGQIADVAFITGDTAQGEVQFVGSSADTDTRTFLAEVAVDNADGAIPAGVSAQLRIPTGTTLAHFVSPAILSLDTDGALGVKTVDSEDEVVFYPIEIVRAQTDGIWVTGLPDEADIIAIGQGYVNDGETVRPELLSESPEAAALDVAAGVPDPAEGGATIPNFGDSQIVETAEDGETPTAAELAR